MIDLLSEFANWRASPARVPMISIQVAARAQQDYDICIPEAAQPRDGEAVFIGKKGDIATC